MPRLELSAALTGAQLASVLHTKLTLPIRKITLWSDSTTVLHWIKSESCHYKVFVGTRVAEIQSLTEVSNWRYVVSANNPADDITRGKTLKELSRPHRWHQGPDFLRYSEDHWPTSPSSYPDASELKKSSFCGHVIVDTCPQLPDVSQSSTWKDLMQTTARSLHGAADSNSDSPSEAADDIKAENLLLRRAQLESFPEEVKALISDRPLPTSSRLGSLSPEYDKDAGLLRIGGRLRRAEQLPQAVYDPSNTLGNRRWRHSQVLVDHFWSRFISHYLPSLQERKKWLKDGKQLEPNQVVLIVDPQLPRALWPVGKVTTTYLGADGRIRTAAIKVKDRTYVRPVARLVQLPKLEDAAEDSVT